MRSYQSIPLHFARPQIKFTSMALLLCLLLVSNAAHAQTPQVRYKLTWLNAYWQTNPNIYHTNMNRQGIVVGRVTDSNHQNSQAFIYVGGQVSNLNLLDAEWTEPGWIATAALDINDFGQVVGIATNALGHSRGYLLNFRTDAPPQFLLLPNVAGSVQTEACRINNYGVVLGIARYAADSEYIVHTPVAPLSSNYQTVRLGGSNTDTRCDINDFGVIVTGTGQILFPNANNSYTINVFNLAQPYPSQYFAINNQNDICGYRRGSSKGKFSLAGGPILTEALLPLENEFLIEAGGGSAFGINDTNDVVFSISDRGYIYSDSNGISLAMDDLVVDQVKQDARWTGSRITLWGLSEREPTTGFPLIHGRANSSTTVKGKVTNIVRSFVLTPE